MSDLGPFSASLSGQQCVASKYPIPNTKFLLVASEKLQWSLKILHAVLSYKNQPREPEFGDGKIVLLKNLPVSQGWGTVQEYFKIQQQVIFLYTYAGDGLS